MAATPAQQAAWDAYLAVAAELLPALEVGRDDVPAALQAVTVRIRRYAPLWGPHGPMLLAAADSARRLHDCGDTSSLTELACAVAQRLFWLSTPLSSHYGDSG
jgi:hypothetical protein